MDSGKEWANELTFEECCNLIDDFAKYNVKMILFTGGEPLIREDFFDICDYAISKTINVGLTTNGTLVTDDIIENQLWKFRALRVSLDSMVASEHDSLRNMPGTFEKVTNSIKKMKRCGYNVSVSTCVSKRNVLSLGKMAAFLTELGVNRWCMPLLSPDGRAKEIMKDVLNPYEIRDFLYQLNGIKKKFPQLNVNIDIPYIVLCDELNEVDVASICPAGVTELTIFANGDISPCFAMVTSVGNIREVNIIDVWEKHPMFEVFRNREILKGKCKECDMLMKCGGGCRANPFIMSNDYLGEDESCWR